MIIKPHKIRKRLPRVLLIVTIAVLFKWDCSPQAFTHYTEFLSVTFSFALTLTGVALSLLGVMNIFRDYTFIKKLFQLNVDLVFTKRLLGFIGLTILYTILTIGALLFDSQTNTIWSRGYVGMLLVIMIQIIWQVLYIGYFIWQTMVAYIEAEYRIRK